MINPISSAQPVDASSSVRHVARPPEEPKPEPQAQTPPVQKSGTVSQDQVTLKSAGQLDQDRK